MGPKACCNPSAYTRRRPPFGMMLVASRPGMPKHGVHDEVMIIAAGWGACCGDVNKGGAGVLPILQIGGSSGAQSKVRFGVIYSSVRR